MVSSYIKTTCIFLSIACCLIITPSLYSALIERDFLTPEDGLLTFDDVNQREWLDLTETLGLELAAIQANMVPGQKWEDFSFATLKDVSDLAASAEVDWIEPWSVPRTTDKELVGLFGRVHLLDFPLEAEVSSGKIAVEVDDNDLLFDGSHFVVLRVVPCLPGAVNCGYPWLGHGEGVFISAPYTLPGADPGAENIGPYWLYRNAVPEPSSMLFVVTGSLIFSASLRTLR